MWNQYECFEWDYIFFLLQTTTLELRQLFYLFYGIFWQIFAPSLTITWIWIMTLFCSQLLQYTHSVICLKNAVQLRQSCCVLYWRENRSYLILLEFNKLNWGRTFSSPSARYNLTIQNTAAFRTVDLLSSVHCKKQQKF